MEGCDSNSNNFENEEDCRKICNAREIGKYAHLNIKIFFNKIKF